MKFLKLALVAAAASVAMGGAAMAQDESGLKLSYNVGVASDYIFRGVSNTNTKGQIFGGVDATYGIGYAGVWTSNVDFGTSNPDQEVDLYAGVKPTVGAFNLDLGVIYYGYLKDKAPESNRTIAYPGSFSYTEVKAAASTAVGPATVGAALYYSPEFPGKGGEAFYYEANGSAPIGEKLTLSGAVGRQQVDASTYYGGVTDSYVTWNLGVSAAINDHLTADIRYSDTNKSDLGSIYHATVTASLKAAF
ncbi:MAG TPA: TorF family putative porin [Caulobacter sp.]|nr:TorF family putative porin [Caulobacter sp.]